MGRAIRQDLTSNNYSYPAAAIAQAYALDRLILYTKLLIPLLAAGKCVLQDRGISTTLCYQPLTSPELTLQALLARPQGLVFEGKINVAGALIALG